MRSNKLSKEDQEILAIQNLVIGKFFKEQRVNNWKKLGFKEPMSAQAMGEFYGFDKKHAARKVFEIENGRNIPRRKTLEEMCLRLGYPPRAMYHTGPYDRYKEGVKAELKALEAAHKKHAKSASAHERHMAFLEGDVSETSTIEEVEEVEAIGEYA